MSMFQPAQYQFGWPQTKPFLPKQRSGPQAFTPQNFSGQAFYPQGPFNGIDPQFGQQFWGAFERSNDPLFTQFGGGTASSRSTDYYKPSFNDFPALRKPQFVRNESRFGSDNDHGIDMGGSGGSIWGDPHFVGDDGERYDVMGKNGHSYNILTDGGAQGVEPVTYNATFDGENGVTYVKHAGISFGSNGSDTKVLFNHKGELEVNGKPVTQDGEVCPGVVKEGGKIRIETQEYVISLWTVGGVNLDQEIKLKDSARANKKTLPHGLWGQTVDPGSELKTVDQNATGNHDAKNGAGVIDGCVDDYEVKDLFQPGGFKFTAKTVSKK